MNFRSVLLATVCVLAGYSQAAVEPELYLDDDPVCDIYFDVYSAKVRLDELLSFETEEIVSHPDDKVYSPIKFPSQPVTFTKPFEHPKVEWMEWHPIAGLEHSFKWFGAATEVTAVGAMPYSKGNSFVLQTTTIGWRGPFFSITLVKDKELNGLVEKHKPAQLPLEEITSLHIDSRTYGISNLFAFEGGFYIATNEGVYKVFKSGKKEVCKVGLERKLRSTELRALQEIANRSLMTEGVTHIPMYYGSMGNPHYRVGDNFATAVEKPWLIRVNRDGTCYNSGKINNCIKNEKVESILAEFAGSDPWSFREVETVRHHADASIHVLSYYYQTTLSLKPKISNGIAKQAVYDLLANAVGKHSLMSYGDRKSQTPSNPYRLDYENGKLKPNWYNKTALMVAAHFNDYDAVSRLIASGEQLNDVTRTNVYQPGIRKLKRTALMYAAENASLHVIKLLIEAGADMTAKDSVGNGVDDYLSINHRVESTIAQIKAMDLAPVSPTFNCGLAGSRQQRAICSSEGLSLYDAELGLVYKAAIATERFPHLEALQRQWLKSVRGECAMERETEVVACIKQKYRPRIRYLQNLVDISQG